MWISKRRFEAMEKKIAALEKEQLKINSIVKSNIDSNEEVISIVKQLRGDLVVKGVNADFAK